MPIAITPTQDDIQNALQAFLVSVLPAGVPVVLGQPNRVPEVTESTFVVFTPTSYTRLRTNIDTAADVRFIGSVAGTALTVTSAGDPATDTFGTILIGATVFGVGVTDATTILDQVSGPTGGAGVYTVDKSQTVGSGVLSSGAVSIEQGAELAVQLDFHSADSSAGNLAQTVSTVLRDEYGVARFAALVPALNVVPLYADDPRQLPFTNDQQQVETRWTLDAMLQVNAVISVPQQFADSAEVAVVNVDATYPPT